MADIWGGDPTLQDPSLLQSLGQGASNILNAVLGRQANQVFNPPQQQMLPGMGEAPAPTQPAAPQQGFNLASGYDPNNQSIFSILNPIAATPQQQQPLFDMTNQDVVWTQPTPNQPTPSFAQTQQQQAANPPPTQDTSGAQAQMPPAMGTAPTPTQPPAPQQPTLPQQPPAWFDTAGNILKTVASIVGSPAFSGITAGLGARMLTPRWMGSNVANARAMLYGGQAYTSAAAQQAQQQYQQQQAQIAAQNAAINQQHLQIQQAAAQRAADEAARLAKERETLTPEEQKKVDFPGAYAQPHIPNEMELYWIMNNDPDPNKRLAARAELDQINQARKAASEETARLKMEEDLRKAQQQKELAKYREGLRPARETPTERKEEHERDRVATRVDRAHTDFEKAANQYSATGEAKAQTFEEWLKKRDPKLYRDALKYGNIAAEQAAPKPPPPSAASATPKALPSAAGMSLDQQKATMTDYFGG